jgi:cytochrome c6
MKKILAASAIVASVCLLGVTAFAKEEAKGGAGETLFKQNCAVCHPDGGNIINPKKTLKKTDLDANGVKTAADIVGKMRNPGPGMTKFDAKTISDKDAKEIAEYVLKAFK